MPAFLDFSTSVIIIAMKYDIFISYRRKDSFGKEWGTSIARNVLQALENRGYKGRVFFDHDEIGPEDFEAKILNSIKQSTIFVFILTKESLLRCNQEGDWVRREICQAVESKLKLIFINPNAEFNNDYPKDFPDELNFIRKENHMEVRMSAFNRDMDDMVIRHIDPILGRRGIPQINRNKVCARFKTDMDCRIFHFGYEVGFVKVGEFYEINLDVGDNALEFVGVDDSEIRLEKVYTIQHDFQPLIMINLLDQYNAIKERKRLSLPDDEFCVVEKDGRYGFALKHSGEIVIPKKYDRAYPFDCGRAAVVLNKKLGFIDKIGKEVIPLIYDSVWRFVNNYTKVMQDNKYGYIDKDGEVIIPVIYDDISYPYTKGFVVARLNNKYGYFDEHGHTTGLKYDYAEPYNSLGFAKVLQNGLFLIINKFGVEYPFVDGVQIIYNNDKCGYISMYGSQITDIKYDKACYFSDGKALVKLCDKYGFIDELGREVIELKYDYAYSFKEYLACVKLDGKYGFIDVSGDIVVPLKYDFAASFNNGLSKVGLNGKYGFINKHGKDVVTIKYDYADLFYDGLACICFNGKYGFIDTDDIEVIPIKYDFAEGYKDGLAHVVLDGKHGFIDKAGNQVISLKYDNASPFSEGLACVSYNGKYGFVDRFGVEVIPMKYSFALPFFEGLSCVEVDGKYGYIDTDDRIVIPFKYCCAKSFSEGLAGVMFGDSSSIGAWGFIDKSDKMVVPAIYDSVSQFRNGLSIVETGAAYGCIDRENKIIIPIQFLSLSIYPSEFGQKVITDMGGWLLNHKWEVIQEHEINGIDLDCRERLIGSLY